MRYHSFDRKATGFPKVSSKYLFIFCGAMEELSASTPLDIATTYEHNMNSASARDMSGPTNGRKSGRISGCTTGRSSPVSGRARSSRIDGSGNPIIQPTARIKSGRTSPQIKEALKDETTFDVITDEEKRLMMLGHVVKSKAAEPLYLREDFCGVCGIQHSNPAVLDMYPYCAICAHTLREPCVLRKRYLGVLPKQPLEVLYATYGDPFDCTKVIDVTAICDELTHEYKTRDRLYIRSSINLCHLFNDGVDFMPGKQKQLRIRYRMKGTVFGYVSADTTVTSRFPTGFFLTVPSTRYLTIVSCTYGHPKGRAATGRMSYDVSSACIGFLSQSLWNLCTMSRLITAIACLYRVPCVDNGESAGIGRFKWRFVFVAVSPDPHCTLLWRPLSGLCEGLVHYV